ncbi:hypothetical protein HNP52_000029 [Sphingomonas kyeonggiensis]|uniref:PD-(D/E)XK nuclease superfamily protein n=1 Tax=Sphingomonas kyeonggiensis TaxID=1268553 RepID=A0A7W7JX43_9SPHN|nr:PD-(D/E)XK nuclease family protein [Sphingomonas kyeonggiensis]MBB4836978.1 hypothetical protein [Sphingomonas kyeonggiensis]
MSAMPRFSAAELQAALRTFAPLKAGLARDVFQQPYPLGRVIEAFASLRAPLARARLQGGIINPWVIAGLRRDEVRVAQALAGLWTLELGGAASRRFLAGCLAACIVDIDWEAELATGYRVASEISPLGVHTERIDLTIETARHIVGIEMKIDAALGPRQLERYVEAISARARWQHATGHIVLLAPFSSELDQVLHLSWPTVAEAAFSSAGRQSSKQSFAEQLIVSFGDYLGTL